MSKVKYFLRDRDKNMARAWKKYFDGVDAVEISDGDIFNLKADALVSPANSFGFMDGGIDLVYINKLGWHVQEKLRKTLADEHNGELPVGQAVIIETGHPEYPYLVSAPTMRVPMFIAESLNAYLAFRATIRAVDEYNQKQPGAIKTVLCPGLGTGIGQMPPEKCAKQMFTAYAICVMGQMNGPGTLAG